MLCKRVPEYYRLLLYRNLWRLDPEYSVLGYVYRLRVCWPIAAKEHMDLAWTLARFLQRIVHAVL
jgi:hypothetical protein